MNEKDWVEEIAVLIRYELQDKGTFKVETGHKLAYASEIRSYNSQNNPNQYSASGYEIDLIIKELIGQDKWMPRVVIEAKIKSVTTHDAITYSHKASTHKTVHPYLRYGIMLGFRKHYPLPGRLFRHGAYFDFMISFQNGIPSKIESSQLMELIVDEIENSRTLERILYDSRKPGRDRFTVLQRRLILK